MAEYIERETYRKRLANLEGWCQDLRKPGLKQALEIFDEIPAADVAPVVHGRWIKGSPNPYCSECFVECRDEIPFCPNCGAKMDGGNS